MVATIECIERSRARDSCAISAPSPTTGRSVSTSLSSRSSSTPSDLLAAAAQDPAADHAVRVGVGGLVEHRGGGCAPVDQQHVAVVVAQPDAADVPRGSRRPRGACRAGRTRGPRGRRRASPSGGPPGRPSRRARRARPRARGWPRARPSAASCLGRAGRGLELAVDGVDELLLAGDLARGDVFVQGWCPLRAGRRIRESTTLFRRRTRASTNPGRLVTASRNPGRTVPATVAELPRPSRSGRSVELQHAVPAAVEEPARRTVVPLRVQVLAADPGDEVLDPVRLGDGPSAVHRANRS